MSVLQPVKLRWYHPLDSETDSASLLWGRATNPFGFKDFVGFVSGQVGDAAEATVTPDHSVLDRVVADYPDVAGETDLTVAMWVNPPATGAYDFLCGWYDVTNTRFQQIGIESSLTALSLRNGAAGNPEVQFNGLISVSRNVWSLVMLNLHHDGSDWEARKSVNGAPWSAPVAPSTGSALARQVMQNTMEFAFIHLVMDGAGGLVDEVAIWAGANLFTSQELSNMYDLGNVLDKGFDQYSESFAGLSITSDPSGVAITVSPNDDNDDGDGTTPITRIYASSTDVTLTAPSASGGRPFAGWRNGDGDTLSLSRSLALTVSAATATATAHYESIGDSRNDHAVAGPT